MLFKECNSIVFNSYFSYLSRPFLRKFFSLYDQLFIYFQYYQKKANHSFRSLRLILLLIENFNFPYVAMLLNDLIRVKKTKRVFSSTFLFKFVVSKFFTAILSIIIWVNSGLLEMEELESVLKILLYC